ncbi:MAG: RNA-binding protein [Micavibrio sp.]|nr:RNA-binding protein [Micavibrio sp.]
MKLRIMDLPRDYSENDLAKLFKQFGNIRDCTLVMDKESGKSKGFGFIEMAVDHEGEEAIQALNGTKIGKSKIRVKAAD